MKNKELLINLVICGMCLGTGWAIRGQFGHEQGAAWAGAIGGLSLILIAKRQDWYQKAFQVALAAAIGWGVSGIISYGVIIGYGRHTDLGNVFYGFLMLLIIGLLYGFVGGGLVGLVLSERKEKPIQWPALICEMTVGGIIFYYFLIEQIGWLMTPPRSEAWAICLGIAAAIFWYMIRNKHYAALRVAVFAGFGAGFGFAFGNFLQTLGAAAEIKFNFWNVMEYSIGFFGGVGMAYGTLTSQWEQSETTVQKKTLLLPILTITLLIPFIVWDQSMSVKKLTRNILRADSVVDNFPLIYYMQGISLLLVIAFAAYSIYYFYYKKSSTFELVYKEIRAFFLTLLTIYTTYSLLITYSFLSTKRPEQYLYIVNIVAIAWLLKQYPQSISIPERGINPGKWSVNLAFTVVIILLLAAVAVSSHDGLRGAESRF
jgi:hypothetical protein